MGRPTGRPAGRPKKQPTFEPPGFKQAVRARFIEYARRHGSAALHLLATDVWRGEMTLDAWAKSFNVAGTWVEAWAQDVLDAWREGIRYPAPAVSESGVLTMWYPSPDDGHTAADVFSCHLTGTPLAQLQHGIISVATPLRVGTPEKMMRLPFAGACMQDSMTHSMTFSGTPRNSARVAESPFPKASI